MTGERAVETWPIFVFRLTFYVHRGSGQARVYPRRRLSLSSRAKAFTLQGRHRRFVGDSAFHTSLRGAPLLVGEQRSGITRFCKKYQVQNLIPHDCIPSCTVKPPHTLVSVLHWLWYCRATAALSALANLILLLRKNTLPFPAFGNYLNFVSPA